jgi:hypothetical protein
VKQCPYCGKEYPDDTVACAVDRQPLTALSPQSPFSGKTKDGIDHTPRHLRFLCRSIGVWHALGWTLASIILSGCLIHYYVCYAMDRLPTAIELDVEEYVFRFFLGSSFLLCVLTGIMGAANVFQGKTTLRRLMCYLAAGIVVILASPELAEDLFFPLILLFPFAVFAILYAIGGCVACYVRKMKF